MLQKSCSLHPVDNDLVIQGSLFVRNIGTTTTLGFRDPLIFFPAGCFAINFGTDIHVPDFFSTVIIKSVL